MVFVPRRNGEDVAVEGCRAALAAAAVLNAVTEQILIIEGEGHAFYEAGYRETGWQPVTLPAIRGTIVRMLIMKVGQLLNTSYDQIFLMQNAMNRAASDVFDTYVYTKGITGGQYSLATATGLFKSTISICLLYTSSSTLWFLCRAGMVRMLR